MIFMESFFFCLSGLFAESFRLKFSDEEGRESEPKLSEMAGKAIQMLSKVTPCYISMEIERIVMKKRDLNLI